jgi:hypothetical protein
MFRQPIFSLPSLLAAKTSNLSKAGKTKPYFSGQEPTFERPAITTVVIQSGR